MCVYEFVYQCVCVLCVCVCVCMYVCVRVCVCTCVGEIEPTYKLGSQRTSFKSHFELDHKWLIKFE